MVWGGGSAAVLGRPSGPLRHPARFSLAVVAAVVLHAGIVWQRSGGHEASPPVSLAPVMLVRSLAIPAPSKVAATPDRSESATAEAGKPPQSASRLAPPAAVEPPPRALRKAPSPAGPDEADPQQAAGSPATVPPVASQPSTASAALPAAPDYLLGARLDPGPRPIGDIEPEYPDSAHLQEGTVVLRLLISEAGTVDNVGIVRAEPKGLFEEAAIEAFGKAKFHPGMALGTAVKSQMMVEVHFLPINRGARISGRSY
ncbi:MAG TPA: TonB family protein [Caldimonas sp.]|jgi:protein TonB|nr:TonB family protein [Caldimonas sp.]